MEVCWGILQFPIVLLDVMYIYMGLHIDKIMLMVAIYIYRHTICKHIGLSMDTIYIYIGLYIDKYC